MTRNLVLTAVVLLLSGTVVWLFSIMLLFQIVRDTQYRPFGDELINVDTGGVTTPVALFFVCVGFGTLFTTVVMLPISAIALGAVVIKGHSSRLQKQLHI